MDKVVVLLNSLRVGERNGNTRVVLTVYQNLNFKQYYALVVYQCRFQSFCEKFVQIAVTDIYKIISISSSSSSSLSPSFSFYR